MIIRHFSCCTDKFEQFWSVNRRLMERNGDDPYFKFIPFRILQVHRIVFVSPFFSYSFITELCLFNIIFSLTLQSDSPFIQQLFRPVTESGK